MVRKDEEENIAIESLDKDYLSLLGELKEKIRSARLRAALALNREVIELYWHIGKRIIEKQEQAKWGEHFLQRLSQDLQNSFLETRGFSVPNLKRMRLFSQTYPSFEIGSQPVSQLPWSHISILISKVKNNTIREWYIRQDIESGWSRETLEKNIKRDLYQQKGEANNKASNFLIRLPEPQSALAQDILKNPYNFDFMGLHDDAQEREIEHGSISHITKFLLELGKGFAFVGRQYPIVFREEEYFIDMLFYHLKLHSFVVIEYKCTRFRLEHAGQLNFYLNLVDDFIKTPQDNQTIGLLLCKSCDKFVAEYSLREVKRNNVFNQYFYLS